jgi:hypothetical protein
MAEVLKVENYIFTEFQILERNVSRMRFRAIPDSGSDAREDDILRITAILNDMGKWESMLKSGSSVFSELGLIPAERQVEYPYSFGAQLYRDIVIEMDGSRDFLWCFVSLTIDERRKRERADVNPIFQAGEIEAQLMNVPKWRSFEKTLTLLKNLWTEQ